MSTRSTARTTVAAEVDSEPAIRWRILVTLGLGELMAMAPWFSSAAVAPFLQRDWELSGFELALLTVAVQFGFAAGALALAATGTADVISSRFLFAVGAIVAALANLVFAVFAQDMVAGIPLRLLTGAGLAAVYPVGMKMLAGWFRRDLGLAIGVLVGALTVGCWSCWVERRVRTRYRPSGLAQRSR